MARANSIALLLIDNRPAQSSTKGYQTGVNAGNAAVTSASGIGAPAGVGLFVDFEANTDMDAAFIEGWYDAVHLAGYQPGIYANTLSTTSTFNTEYCKAVAASATYANSYLWASVRSPGRTSKATAPAFNPVKPPCASQTVMWQYGLSPGTAPNVDTDEATTSAPFWHIAPTGTATTTSLGANPPSPGAADSPVTLTATISPAAAGTVQFYDGETPLSAVTVVAGTASTSPTLPGGVHTLRASFIPSDVAYAPSQASTTYQVGPLENPTFTLGTNVIAAGQKTKVVVHGSPGDSVQVLVKGAASSSYTAIATLHPNTAGVASLIISPSTTSSYAVRNVNATTAPKSLLVKAVQSLVVQISGRTGTFTGHIAPSLVGRVVTVYYYVDGGHTTPAGSAKTTSGGQFRVTHVFPAHTTINVFAQTNADAYNAAGRSSLRTVTTGA